MASSFKSPHRRTRITSVVTTTVFAATCLTAVAVVGVLRAPPTRTAAAAVPTSSPPTTILETRYIDDPLYVPIGAAPSTGSDPSMVLPPTGDAVPGAPAAIVPVTAAVPSAEAAPPIGRDELASRDVGGDEGAGPAAPASTSVPPTTVTVPPAAAPTTLPAAPTTTLPQGARIPRDWPPGKPIPPVPPGCRKPVLEDNGVWNCDH